MTHTLTIYGKDVRVSVQTKGLGVKAASEVTAHFSKTISQALLDAPHVGVLREQQVIELDAELLEKVEEAPATPAAVVENEDGTFKPVDRAGRPLKARKAAKKARKGAKKRRR